MPIVYSSPHLNFYWIATGQSKLAIKFENVDQRTAFLKTFILEVILQTEDNSKAILLNNMFEFNYGRDTDLFIYPTSNFRTLGCSPILIPESNETALSINFGDPKVAKIFQQILEIDKVTLIKDNNLIFLPESLPYKPDRNKNINVKVVF